MAASSLSEAALLSGWARELLGGWRKVHTGPMRRRALACTGAGALLFLTSACTADSGGSVGLTRDASGHLVAVIEMCRGYVDGLTLYRDDTNNGDSHKNDRGKWVSSKHIKSAATVDLSAPSNGWKAETSLVDLAPRQEVRLYGWSKSSKWSVDGPTFYPDALARLDSDHILFGPTAAQEKHTDHGLIPRNRFREFACP
jgi:hypothetical protein